MSFAVYQVFPGPLEGAVGPVWLAESRDAVNYHCRYYDSLRLITVSELVKDRAIQDNWHQKTLDFLSSKGFREDCLSR